MNIVNKTHFSIKNYNTYYYLFIKFKLFFFSLNTIVTIR